MILASFVGARLLKPLATVCVLLIGLTSLLWYGQDNITFLSHPSTISPDVKLPSQRWKHPIMILQHNCHCQNQESLRRLTEVSREQHSKYAAAHGYVYEMSDGNFVPKDGWGGQGYLNKVHLLMKVILAEMDGEQPVEWVMLADTDTLIIDPSVNIHELLPPPSTYPAPMTLGNRDLNGFNAGVVIWRVNHRTVTFLARMLTMEYNAVEPSSSDQPQPQYVSWAPSDQWLIALVLQNYKDAREHFYEIPQDWFSSYFDPISWPNITDAVPTASVRGWIHMAGTLKTDWDWETFLDIPEEIYELAETVARDLGVQGNGLDLMAGAEKARKEAEEWWRVTKNGVDSMRWFSA